MALAKSKFNNTAGFSLVEVMIATTLLAMSLTALAQLFAISVKNNAVAKNGTFTQILAAQKMEHYEIAGYGSLTGGFDPLGLPVSDVATDTTVSPEAATGGKGLAPSPTNTLQANTNGYVDYIDPQGNPLGGGTVVPDNTAYIRRWLIEPLPTMK